jgi:hypothetical protein
MEKAIASKPFFEDENQKIKLMYEKVIGCTYVKRFIKCPECTQEILVTISLRSMNEVIENHVKLHREETTDNLILKYTKPINIRLALAQQVLQSLKK